MEDRENITLEKNESVCMYRTVSERLGISLFIGSIYGSVELTINQWSTGEYSIQVWSEEDEDGAKEIKCTYVCDRYEIEEDEGGEED